MTENAIKTTMKNANATIIIADDDQAICTVLSHAVSRSGWNPLVVHDGMSLLALIENKEGDLVISDVRMPVGDAGKDGLDVVAALSQIRPELPVIVISAQNSLMTAVRANQVGAYEYLAKPFDLDLLIQHIKKALSSADSSKDSSADSSTEKRSEKNHEKEGKQLKELKELKEIKFEAENFVGSSPAMQNIYRILARMVDNDLTVTISGESGTGKELIARALHNFGKRKNAPFVAINMAAIPRELVESELFGHEKGAFTGALQRKSGKFEQAEGGTLFLDEIGDMPLEAQTKLLRVLQQGEFISVGGQTARKTNVRIVCATHRDMALLVANGSFREDLYYRLNVVPLRIPPLRQRREDILPLAEYFLNKAATRGLAVKKLSPAAKAVLHSYNWPGNVRELEHLIYRLAALTSESIIDEACVAKELALEFRKESRENFVNDTDDNIDNTDNIKNTDNVKTSVNIDNSVNTLNSGNTIEQDIRLHLSQYFSAHGEGSLPPSGLYERILPLFERPLIELTLAATGFNQVKAAHILGINRNTLRKKIADLGISLYVDDDADLSANIPANIPAKNRV